MDKNNTLWQQKDNELIKAWLNEIKSIYKGHDKIILLILTAIIADGHILLEDLPGSGKTLLAKTISKTIEFDHEGDLISNHNRIQFTPDLLPMDILGVNIFNPKDANFRFLPGPVFSNILLVDEINRASPKVQSALLEAMAEKQVSIDKVTYKLEDLFFVIGTENPIDHEGVFPLPLAQLDRFFMRLTPGFLHEDTELLILKNKGDFSDAEVKKVVHKDQILHWRKICQDIELEDKYYLRVNQILKKSRTDNSLFGGLSTRSGIHLIRALKAWTLLRGFDSETIPGEEQLPIILPEEFQLLAFSVLLHRIPQGAKRGQEQNTLRNIILEETESLVQINKREWKKTI